MTDVDLFGHEPPAMKIRLRAEILGGDLLIRLIEWDDAVAERIRSLGGTWSRRVGGYRCRGSYDQFLALVDAFGPALHPGSEVRAWLENGAPDLAVNTALARARAEACRPTATSIADMVEHMDASLRGRHNDRPLPYQIVAACSAYLAGGRFLLGDPMGLGKTVEALTWLSRVGQRGVPALVICTASGRLNWVREARKWLPASWTITTIEGGNDRWDPDTTDVLVVTYGLIGSLGRTQQVQKQRPLGTALTKVRTTPWASIIVDEAHRIASWDALQTKAVRRLGRVAPHFIALSATPVMRSPLDLHGVLRTIAPDLIGNRHDFGARYCDPTYHQMPPPGREKPGTKSRRWWTYDGLTAVDELRGILAGMMIRRGRDEVRTEIAGLRRCMLVVPVEPVQYRNAEAVAQQIIVATDDPAAAMRAVMDLWHALGMAKVPSAAEWIADYCAGQERPLVVFYHHRDVGAALASAISDGNADLRVTWIDGSVTGAARDQVVQDFQAGAIDVLLASTKAAGESITLTRACDCLIVERQWTAYAEEQAEGRIDRHGQTSLTTATYLCAVSSDGSRTQDEDMAELIEARRVMAARILDPDAQGVAAQADLIQECVARLRSRA